MDKNNIIRLTKKHTYLDADESYLNKIEKNLDELLVKELLDDEDILIIAKFLFKKGKYQKALAQFNKLLENKQYSSSAYYGMYKCYLMLKNYENSYKCLLEYLKLNNNKKLNDGTAIILSAFEIILNDKYDYNINCTESFLMNRLIDDDLKIKYKELVEAYNSKKYKKCIFLADECEQICREKKLKIEFYTFENLLNKVDEHVKVSIKNNLQNIYKQLKNSIENQEYNTILDLINIIPNNNLNNELIYNSIYILIKNNYIEEAKNILVKIIISNKNKIIIKTLKNAVENQIEYNNLSDVEKQNFQRAIEMGHIYYNEGDLINAYYTYTYGYYTTNNNIFLYYIGKILFKLGRGNEALEYFKNYIKVGSDKISKAYLYLAAIYQHQSNYKKASYFGNNVDNLNKIFLTDYQMYYIYDKKDENIDALKLNLQNKADIK